MAELLRRGWRVLAIDAQTEAIERLLGRTMPGVAGLDRLETRSPTSRTRVWPASRSRQRELLASRSARPSTSPRSGGGSCPPYVPAAASAASSSVSATSGRRGRRARRRVIACDDDVPHQHRGGRAPAGLRRRAAARDRRGRYDGGRRPQALASVPRRRPNLATADVRIEERVPEKGTRRAPIPTNFWVPNPPSFTPEWPFPAATLLRTAAPDPRSGSSRRAG